MIAPLGKYLRKWLLGLAVAARNRVQVIVARLESEEEKKAKEAGPGVTLEGSKTARPGGPPDHWVQLVKRHAPELLQTGPPYLVSRAPSPLFERDGGLDGSAAKGIQELRPDPGTLDDGYTSVKEDPTHSSAFPWIPEEFEDPGSQRETRGQDGQRQTGDDLKINGAASKSPEHIRDATSRQARGASRSGSVESGRPSLSPAGADSTLLRRTGDRERYKKSVPGAGPATRPREAEHTVSARPFQSTNGPVVNARADAGEQNRIPATEQSGKRGEHGYPKAFEHEAGLEGDTRRPISREVKQEAGDDIQPLPGGASQGMASGQDTGRKMSASKTLVSKESDRPVNETWKINGQRTSYPQWDREKIAEKKSPPPELSWPSLPGEKDSEDVRARHLTVTWPVLPEDRPMEVRSPSNQLEPYPAEAESRHIARLRRLDEEQKGRPWNASHF